MREIHTDLKGREREVLIPVASFTPTDIARIMDLLGFLERTRLSGRRWAGFNETLSKILRLYEAEVGRVIDASHP